MVVGRRSDVENREVQGNVGKTTELSRSRENLLELSITGATRGSNVNVRLHALCPNGSPQKISRKYRVWREMEAYTWSLSNLMNSQKIRSEGYLYF